MVNAKNFAFKVQPQQPNSQASVQAYGTVLNCRRPVGKRAPKEQKEVRSRQVIWVNVEGTLKRKRDDGEDASSTKAPDGHVSKVESVTTTGTTTPDLPACSQQVQTYKPPRLRRNKIPTKGVDLDCWFIILSFSEPAQLLLMRRGIPSCYHFLRDNPTLWKHSRMFAYGTNLPEPPSELTEYQYADLRHDHGCMSCKAPNTRKTYWAFLRRWCKNCLQNKTIRENDAMPHFRSADGEDLSFLHKCLPSGIFDSWGNFVGVGPATTHALKTVYLRSDIDNIVAEYDRLKAQSSDPTTWVAELHAWYQPKVELVEERRAFAHKMESWEESLRTSRTNDYSDKKKARKEYFQDAASKLEPPITVKEMECCPSYRRAIAIPKAPNSISWLQLKPKLEKEVADLRATGGPPEDRPSTASASGTSTPMSVMEMSQPQPQRPFTILPSIGFALGFHAALGAPHSRPF
ncbi:hypothetical protein IQ06DRAFT_297335 [Phaeosphaeriaceae sp. SRC1lsM3a]|nr:hypothetical protein IQ06DRAFT_297335 [Stagonospora sp. SRC1lsM3a]